MVEYDAEVLLVRSLLQKIKDSETELKRIAFLLEFGKRPESGEVLERIPYKKILRTKLGIVI